MVRVDDCLSNFGEKGDRSGTKQRTGLMSFCHTNQLIGCHVMALLPAGPINTIKSC